MKVILRRIKGVFIQPSTMATMASEVVAMTASEGHKSAGELCYRPLVGEEVGTGAGDGR